MSQVQFVIPGPPKGKGRPRFRNAGTFVQTYTPKDTANYENLVRIMYDAKCKNVMLEGAIRAEIVGYFPIPSSTSKKRQKMMEDGEIKYTKKIDCDNLAKIILDSLNKIAFADDAQVCELVVQKRYSSQPRVAVRLTELDDEKTLTRT